MTRWIRVNVSVFEHEVFAEEPFSEREAWLWLVSNAAWKETRHRVGNDILAVPLGSLFMTLRGLQSVWKWKSDKRVRSFLSLLEGEGMVEVRASLGKTHITISNYSRYQETTRSDDARMAAVPQRTEAPAPSKQKSKQDVEGFKVAISTVLDVDRVEAICTVRRKKGAVFTAHAGKLLVDALTACPDPASAADEMVLRNWTSVKPEWLDRNGRRSPSGPQKTAFQLHQEAFARELDKTIYGNNHHDDRPDNVVDLAATDYRYSGTPSPVRR